MPLVLTDITRMKAFPETTTIQKIRRYDT